MSSSTPTPLSDTPMSPLSYQLSRSPSTEAPALNPSTRLSPPENPIHFPVPSSVFPNPSFVISRVKPWKSRLYCSRRSIQPPSKRTFPSESIESSLTWNAGQSRPPKSGVTWPLNVAVKVPPVNAKPRLSRSRRRMFGFVSVTRPSSVRNAAVNDPSRLSPISTSTSSSKYGRVMVPTISEDSRLFWTKVLVVADADFLDPQVVGDVLVAALAGQGGGGLGRAGAQLLADDVVVVAGA